MCHPPTPVIFLGDDSKEGKMGGKYDTYGREKMMRESEVKRPLGKLKLRWNGNIRLDISRGVNWIDVVQHRGKL